ncbi:DUF6070 family protein [Cellulosilyticum sp. WCF-2]|uniref:DUF6070 family protein n=1 Tax=Cellulosilyticum sp. WCF-2 TaxID=2497860 RepID=UPI000F8F5F9F|nr:DUF6070 family protein [Cellulosilyticum sp. WCF-2]QEH70070.1 hypothetical protein EKH84_17395 [Cellulosilyticum sp. WCF-2]
MKRLKRMIILLVCLTGCSGLSLQENEAILEEQYTEEIQPEYVKLPMSEEEKRICSEEILEVANLYRVFYQSNPFISEEQIKEIVEIVGEAGIPVTDSDNKVNMKNPQIIESFCKEVEAGEDTKATLYRVTIDGGIVRLDFNKEEDSMSVMQTVVSWNDSKEPEITYMEKFIIYQWQYTRKGYLLYKRSYESLAPFGMDYNDGYEAIRVIPLRDEYRQLCKKYIESIGYENNNLFLTNWNENDLGELQFNDLFEKLYYLKMGHWIKLEDYTKGIETEVFEELIMTYFDISKAEIRRNALYDEVLKKYIWYSRSAGEYTFQTPPLPEVIDCIKHQDGTLTLVVDAVWPQHSTDSAFTHEVTIRLKEQGRFVYVSNSLKASEEDIYPAYIPRTKENSTIIYKNE